MIRRPAFPVEEVRGRLLHDALLAEARTQIGVWCDGVPVVIPPHTDPPDFPQTIPSDPGTLRAVANAV